MHNISDLDIRGDFFKKDLIHFFSELKKIKFSSWSLFESQENKTLNRLVDEYSKKMSQLDDPVILLKTTLELEDELRHFINPKAQKFSGQANQMNEIIAKISRSRVSLNILLLQNDSKKSLREMLQEGLDHLSKIKFPSEQVGKNMGSVDEQFKNMVTDCKNSLLKAENEAVFFNIISDMEKKFSILTNNILRGIPENTPLQSVSSLLDALGRIEKEMKEINVGLAKHVGMIIEKAVVENPGDLIWDSLNSIKKNTQSDNYRMPSGASKLTTMKFLALTEAGKSLMLASLLKESGTEKGKEFIVELSKSITEHLKLTVNLSLTEGNDCMAVDACKNEAFAKFDSRAFLYHYDIVLMSEKLNAKNLQEGKIYLHLEGDRLSYIVSGMEKLEQISTAELGEKDRLTLNHLQSLQTALLTDLNSKAMLTRLQELPNESPQFEQSQYILTDTKLYYFNKLNNQLDEILDGRLEKDKLVQLHETFKQDSVLSDEQLMVIKSAVNYFPRKIFTWDGDAIQNWLSACIQKKFYTTLPPTIDQLTLLSDKILSLVSKAGHIMVNDKLIDQRLDKSIIPNSGSASTLSVPAIFPENTLGNINTVNQFVEKEVDIVDTWLREMMDGGFYFDQGEINFIPIQIQIMHELIHIMHNAQGLNVRNIPLKKEEKKLWSTFEEYQTIQGGHINEAQLASAYGANPRDRHLGTISRDLFTPEGRAKYRTIGELRKEYGFSEQLAYNTRDVFNQFKSTYHKGNTNPSDESKNESKFC